MTAPMPKQDKAPQSQPKSQPKSMKDITALCKRRGFIFPASEIYGGLNGFWDFGPLGVELKNNLRDYWWRKMVTTPPIGPDGQPVQIVGVDSAIIQNPQAWVASGHVGGFSDPMVDCRETKLRYRADHIVVLIPKDGDENWIATADDDPETIEKRIKKVGKGKSVANFEQKLLTELDPSDYAKILGPDTKEVGSLTEPKDFNLMFETRVGALATSDAKAYLRPETAQGIFLNFKNVVDTARVKMPFGIAQIGKAFRNEVTPRNYIYRSREFEQMEMEWFCHEDEAKKWFDFWINTRKEFWLECGLKEESLTIRPHDQDELSHYAKNGHGTVDVEFKFPFTDPGFGELEGIAHRSNFDLTQHQEHSKQKLEYLDPERNNEKYIPHVIEPAAGLTRGVLALISDAYTVDPDRPSGVFLDFKPSIAPKKAAILPLTAKEDHVPLATDLYLELREQYNVDLDIKQNIGKRYARQDEIGTPFCFTIDNDTIEDKTITVRHRNSMKQERIKMDEALSFMDDAMRGN